MKHCPNRDCPHFRAVGSPAEYVADVVKCSDCGAVLEDGAVPEPQAAEGATTTPPVLRRLAVTLGVIPVLWALPWVSLPGVDMDAVRGFVRSSGLPMSRTASNMSVFALGITPLLSAGLLIGLALLFVPRWRRLVDQRAGQRKLRWAAAILTLAITVFQAFGVERLLRAVPDVYAGSAPMTVLTLTAGTMLLIAAAELISRYGLGNGYSLLVLHAALGGEIDRAAARFSRGDSPLAPVSLALFLGAPVVLVYVLGRLLDARRAFDRGARAEDAHDGPHTYRVHAVGAGGVRPSGGAPFLRMPAAGVEPLAVGAMLLASAYEPWWRSLGLPSFVLDRSDPRVIGLFALLVVVAAVLLTYWLHSPERLVAAWRAGDDGGHDAALAAARSAVRRAAIRSALLITGVGVLVLLATPVLGYFPAAASLFLVAAVGLDLLSEWRARRASGELVTVATRHDIDTGDAALAALHAAGIAAHARGAHHRALLQLFGPYIPVELMVAPEHAEAAAEVLAPFGGDDERAPVEETAPPKRRKRRKKKADAAGDQRGGETSRET